MAFETSLKEMEKIDAAFPAALHRALGDYFSELEVRILTNAAWRARSRTRGRGVAHVDWIDLREATKELVANIAVEVDDFLAAKEPVHVKRNAS